MRQEYNNMRIKEEDKWEAAFTTLEESFELTVMFFGFMNSLATFQVMMNELLRDFINMEKMQSFIDDVMVGIESKEGHDDLVEEILRRTKQNNLYVKPEKCK